MNETFAPARSAATASRESEIKHLRAKLIELIAQREAQKRTEKEAPERR